MLVDGSFRDLADELAGYIDGLRKAQNPDDSTSLREEISPLLNDVTQAEQIEDDNREDEIDKAKDAVLEVITKVSTILNTAQEKGS